MSPCGRRLQTGQRFLAAVESMPAGTLSESALHAAGTASGLRPDEVPPRGVAGGRGGGRGGDDVGGV